MESESRKKTLICTLCNRPITGMKERLSEGVWKHFDEKECSMESKQIVKDGKVQAFICANPLIRRLGEETELAGNCKHNELRFGSGGYYIICSGCDQWWVAILGSDSETGLKCLQEDS